MKTLAIVGTGIAGLGCAHFLHPHYELTLYEQNSHIGGHSNTVMVTSPQKEAIPVDTGFMVFNQKTYPNLSRLFKDLTVPVVDTDMSFSVQYQPDQLEWCGSGFNHLFAQRKNLLSLRYWRMLFNLNRFNSDAARLIAQDTHNEITITELVKQGQYGDDFLNWFLIPMSAAIWSTSPEQMLQFPARTLLRFFQNHGFLGMKDHLQWQTVQGGSQEYVKRLIAPFAESIRKNQPVVSVERYGDSVLITDAYGRQERFDQVILACHADEARALLKNATSMERDILEPFHYERNEAILHTDASVMPQRPLCWASWNYQVHHGADGDRYAATHYWMNNLQHLSSETNYFVSINAGDIIHPDKVIQKIPYEHPIFTIPVIQAQKEALPNLNRQSPNQLIYFCGSYFQYGFHEDAFTSALNLSRILLDDSLWRI